MSYTIEQIEAEAEYLEKEARAESEFAYSEAAAIIRQLLAENDALREYANLGKVAMRFVDRAGDVHPSIDDADTICAEFHAAMSEAVSKLPHCQRMQADIDAARLQSSEPTK